MPTFEGVVCCPSPAGRILSCVTRLNGKQIVDFTDPAPKFTEGVMGLQLHTGAGVKIRFKDVYIQELN